jgi:hypothetical protein
MPKDFQPFDSWWHGRFGFYTDNVLWKPYSRLYSHVNLKDLTLIETLRVLFRVYQKLDIASKRKPKTPSNAAVAKKHERLFKWFGHIVAGMWCEVLREWGSLKPGEVLALEANMEGVIDRAFQTLIQVENGLAQNGPNPKDSWKEIVRLVTPHVPKLNRLALKYHPGPRSNGRTPETWQTFILLAIVNYLEQKMHKPHYRETVNILNAVGSHQQKHDRLSVGSARARVIQFKKAHPDWHSDVEMLYRELRQQFTTASHDSTLLANPVC